MKTNKEFLAVSTLTLAVQGALLAMFAMPPLAFAADDEVTALTHPTNSIEVGVDNTSADSAKFGQYNGLNKSGASLIGNFNIRGGDAYNQEGGVNRWEIKGTDLGTTSRELSGSMSNQGQWTLGFGYDELQHNISDTYQTPFVGSMGGNSFSLPAKFGLINTGYVATDPNGVKKLGAQILTLDQQNAFQTTDVHTDRKNTSFTAGYDFDRQWGLKFNYNRLEQTGAKLMSSGTDNWDILGSLKGKGPSGSDYKGEAVIMLMNPTNYTTDTFNLALNWTGDKSFLNASYFGSFFRDGYNGLTWQNPYVSSGTLTTSQQGFPATLRGAAGYPSDTLSTMPGNDFHQLNLTGGYTLSPTTKLVGGLSYGRNTQDESYSGSNALMMSGGLPQGSLNALVVSTHADLKLTNQTSKDLVMSAGLKYNERDNQTASNTYKFIDINGGTNTAVNTPMSNSKTQMELAGDYRISQSNRLHLGYEYEDVKRWCNNALANSFQGQPPGYGYPAGYVYANSSCVQIPESKENKLVANYKLKAGEAVDFNAGYSYAERKADVNAAFYNPMQANNQGYEFTGYRAFFDASRTEQLLKAGVNWQANDKLSLGLNGRYVDDKYDDSTLGVQNGNSWTANLDATYSYSENGSITAYLTQQHRQRDLTNQQRDTLNKAATATAITVPVGSTWSNQLKDDSTAIGFGVKQGGLMGGKLQLAGDLTYSLGTTGYGTQLNYPGTTSTGLTCSDPSLLACGSTPDIKSEVLTLKVTGMYQLDKASKIVLGYMYQKLTSNDYYYNAYQYGYTPTTLLPTNEQAPSYSVNVVSMSYIYNF